MAAGKGLAAAVAVGLALRLAFALGYWTHEPLTRDEREYLSLARSLAAGRGLVYDDAMLSGPVQPFGRAPGYPAFLALVGGGTSSRDDVPASVNNSHVAERTMFCDTTVAMALRPVSRAMIQKSSGWMLSILSQFQI